MLLDDFIATNLGKKVELYGEPRYQCVDLVEQYNRDVIGAPRLYGNAADFARNPQPNFYTYIKNTLMYIPPRGAIAVWNRNVGNGNGHTAIVLEANLMKFKSLDQNWPQGDPVLVVDHDYKNVDGFLVPKRNWGAQDITIRIREIDNRLHETELSLHSLREQLQTIKNLLS